MGKAYSADLRERAVACVDSGLSKMQVSRTFGIARSTLDDWLALREKTGQLRDKSRRPRAAALPDTVEVRAFIKGQRHSTLAQMAQAWEQATGQRLTPMTFCNSLRRLGYTRKKRVFSTRSAMDASETSSSDKSGT